MPQPNKQADSKTRVHMRLHGERTTMTVRILPKLKEDFTDSVRQLGLSTCHVVEGLINGWLYGLNENLALVHQSPTINMTLVREVKRRRRYAVEEEVIEESRAVCGVCGKLAVSVGFLHADRGRMFVCEEHAVARKKQFVRVEPLKKESV